MLNAIAIGCACVGAAHAALGAFEASQSTPNRELARMHAAIAGVLVIGAVIAKSF